MYILISFLLFETDESHFKDDIVISLPDNVVPGSVNAIISTVGKKCYKKFNEHSMFILLFLISISLLFSSQPGTA